MLSRIPRLLLLLVLLTPWIGAPEHEATVVENDDPDAAAAYFAAKRGLTSAINPHPLYDAARAEIARMPHTSVMGERLGTGRLTNNAVNNSAPGGTWQSLGPGNVGGRTRALLVDPIDPNTMYAAAVSGGVFKTVDGGAQWQPTTDLLANLAVNSLAFDPSDSRVLYAGTGEGYYREDVRGTAVVIRGNGIFTTRDAGATWAQLPATAGDDFAFVNKLAVSNHDPRRLYAATRTGVWRSLDAGATWSRVLTTTVKGGCLDLAFRRDTAGDYLFASCGIFQTATVYRNRNAEGAGAWESVLSEPAMGRTSLAIAPSNPSVVYALAASNAGGDFEQGLLAVFRSSSNGDAGSWTAQVRNTDADRLSTLLLTNAYPASLQACGRGNGSITNMGWHCNVITVDPLNPNRLWAGGVDLYRSDDGGRRWRLASYWWPAESTPSFVHADQHGIIFDPRYNGTSNQRVYFVNDGGVYATDNANATIAASGAAQGVCQPDASLITFRSLNHGFTATQFYHGVATPDGRTWFGGAQDNGTPRGTDLSGGDGWHSIFPGDGGYTAVDPLHPATIYASYQYASIGRSDDGGQTWRDASSGLNDDFVFIAPYTLDPNETSRVWTGGRFLWRSEDRGESWSRVNEAGQLDGQLTAIAVAPGDSGRVVAGSNTGSIMARDPQQVNNGSTFWALSQPRAGFVSSLTFTGPKTVYATYALFGGGPHLWRSTDGGVTWAAVGTDLPDIPLHSLAAYGNRLFLGSDLGVFVSFDGGTTWAADTSFPAVITESVFTGQGAHGPALYAFTHGRGAWRADLILPPTGPKRRIAR
jgi:photosystem II stability/assembly factor-like uncharacterized protein